MTTAANEPNGKSLRELAEQQAPAMDAMRRAELDHQIAVAKQYPRSLAEFRARAMSMATLDKETATACFYVLKRKAKGGGYKFIEGPGIRLAEIMAATYGNVDYGSAPGPVEEKRVIGIGYCRDLETNSSCVKRVARRITYSSGGRYGDDMIATTTAAAVSIAMRNAILTVIPQALCKSIIRAAQDVAAGDAKTLPQTIDAAITQFAELGVSEPQVLTWLDRTDKTDIDLQDIRHLRGAYTVLREGHQTATEMFPPPAPEGSPKRGRFGDFTKPAEPEPTPQDASPTSGNEQQPAESAPAVASDPSDPALGSPPGPPAAAPTETEQPAERDPAMILAEARQACIKAFTKVAAADRKLLKFTRKNVTESDDPAALAKWTAQAMAQVLDSNPE